MMQFKLKDITGDCCLLIYKNDLKHRNNKPAVITKYKQNRKRDTIHIEYRYYQYGKFHNENGSAWFCSGCNNDDHNFYLNGKFFSQKTDWEIAKFNHENKN